MSGGNKILTKIGRFWAGLLATAIAILLFQSAVLPNAAPPFRPGDQLGELWGNLEPLEIVEETLAIDLRPLEVGKEAKITATYSIQNRGPSESVELLFIAPNAFSDRTSETVATVTLDDAPISYQMVREFPVPEEWQVPSQVPAAFPFPDRPDQMLSYNSYDFRGETGFKFVAEFPEAPSRLQVAYDMIPSTHQSGRFYWDYQIVYILAPAKAWKDFGTLNVTVNYPPDWHISTTLPMTETEPGLLTAQFDGIPANYLAVTSVPPDPPEKLGYIQKLSAIIGQFGIPIAMIMSLYFAWRSGVFVARLRVPIVLGGLVVVSASVFFFVLMPGMITDISVGLEKSLIAHNNLGEAVNNSYYRNSFKSNDRSLYLYFRRWDNDPKILLNLMAFNTIASLAIFIFTYCRTPHLKKG